MRAPRGGSTPKQIAYARRVFGGQGKCKKEIALDVGYSMTSANSVVEHIENSEGFHNAMAKLAADSNNLALKAMEEFKARGFKGFTNGELTNALNAIGSAWSRFNQQNVQRLQPTNEGNRLRAVVMERMDAQPTVEITDIKKR